jgi:hypothetical protein
MHIEWEIDISLASKSAFKSFKKQHEREFVSCFANLNKIVTALNSGKKVAALANNPAFFRPEGMGVFRIGQTGVGSAKESRLYVYPDEKSSIVYVLAIGTKETQNKDIASSKKMIAQLSRNS